jgi:hypothetical protein
MIPKRNNNDLYSYMDKEGNDIIEIEELTQQLEVIKKHERDRGVLNELQIDVECLEYAIEHVKHKLVQFWAACEHTECRCEEGLPHKKEVEAKVVAKFSEILKGLEAMAAKYKEEKEVEEEKKK